MNDLKLIQDKDIPQQTNDFDCGVFSVALADFKSDNLPLVYSQTDMPYWRTKIGCDIVRGKLRY